MTEIRGLRVAAVLAGSLKIAAQAHLLRELDACPNEMQTIGVAMPYNFSANNTFFHQKIIVT
ncbi:MAG: hypothetical protein LBR08_13115 [Bacteroidales bacterium]|jgi:hypothetical protein|nr:hypothetical protein [Bacteroidales bacterium]